MCPPKHGAKRNYRIEKEATEECFQLPSGEQAAVAYTGKEASVVDRFCSVCGEWVTAKGIIGNVCCKNCKTSWLSDVATADTQMPASEESKQ